MNENKLKQNFIYKILTVNEWEEFKIKGFFNGSQLDQKDGFIHASFEDQYPLTIEKFFNDVSPLVLVTINTDFLDPDCLKIESNKPNGPNYPHIYGSINLNAVYCTEVILTGDGNTQIDN